MIGGAYNILQQFKARHQPPRDTFRLASLIVLARVDPDAITEDLDDPTLEERLISVIGKMDEAPARRTPRAS